MTVVDRLLLLFAFQPLFYSLARIAPNWQLPHDAPYPAVTGRSSDNLRGNMVYSQTAADARADEWKFNPLEGGDSLANAPMPPRWEPWHVQRRMVDAARIAVRDGGPSGPKQPGGAHPAVCHSREDIADQEPVALDPSRFKPTREELSFMGRIFAWLSTMPSDVGSDIRRALRLGDD